MSTFPEWKGEGRGKSPAESLLVTKMLTFHSSSWLHGFQRKALKKASASWYTLLGGVAGNVKLFKALTSLSNL